MPHEKYQTDFIAQKAAVHNGSGADPKTLHEAWAEKMNSRQLKSVLKILGVEIARRKDVDPLQRQAIFSLTTQL